MIVLGIESTAHTFGIGITDGSKILCNEKDVYVPKEGWGIVPGEASKHHDQKAHKVLEKALKSSGVSLDEVDFIALSTGPGLPTCSAIPGIVICHRSALTGSTYPDRQRPSYQCTRGHRAAFDPVHPRAGRSLPRTLP